MSDNNLGELAAALAKAQAAFPKVTKDKTAKIASAKGEYSYKYADLASLLEATRKPLTDNGLVLCQPIETTEQGMVLHTILLHSSGAHLDSYYPLASHDRPQEMGSEITYSRRYTASAILGVASEDDDDGAAAQQSETRRAPATSPRPASDGTTRIASVELKTGTTKGTGKPWKRWDIRFEDGRSASTFDLQIAGRAERYAAADVLCTPTIEINGRNMNLVGLETDADVPWSDEPPFGPSEPQATPSPRSTETLTLRDPSTEASAEERKALLLKARKLGEALGMTNDQKHTAWVTYCGDRAVEGNVSVAALHDLVNWLETRASQKGVAA